MKSRFFLTVIVLSLTIFSLAFPLASADYVVSIRDDGVTVHITGSFDQGVPNSSANNTASIFDRFPAFKVTLSGGNATLLTSLLNEALRERSASARADNVLLTATSNETSIRYELSFRATGILTARGNVNSVDLSWRSFAFRDEVLPENVSINRVLPSYLEPRISLLANQQPTPGPFQRQDLWYLNDLITPARGMTANAENLVLFNFTSLSKPLPRWTRTFDLDTGMVRYQASTGFNLTYILRITEIDETANFAIDAIHKVSASIEAPYSTLLGADELVFETTNEWESKLMVIVVISSLGLLVSTIILERYVLGHRSLGKRKK